MNVPRINLLAWAIMCWTLAAVILVAGCATTPGGRVADGAVHADHGLSAAALLAVEGASEANPLWPLAPVRYALTYKAEAWRCDARRPVHAATTASGAGGAMTGACALAGVTGPWGVVVCLASGAVGGYALARATECEPHLAPDHGVILADWERAYEAGDAEALGAILDNDALLARYADLFEATDQRDAVYTRAETVRGGFVTAYEVTLHYPDRRKRLAGELRFQVDDGRITAAG